MENLISLGIFALMKTDEYIIEINNLIKIFKGLESPAVNDITLTIKEREIFGLLGPNGAGKTTTLSVLCGLVKASSGKIKVGGMDLHSSIQTIKQIIGVVPQEIALYPTLTARENLNFYGHMYGLSGKELKDKIELWLNNFGLTAAANKKVTTYSGGMKRRVNLIAGILHSPKILFLDEPTVGVDVQSRNVIIEHLKELNKQGMTIIYTSHHMDEAEHFCSRVAIIDYGKIIAEGLPKELIQSNNCNNLENLFLKLTHRNLRD